MPIYEPEALNAPETVYSLTLAKAGVVQMFVDTTNLAADDVLNVKVASDITGDMRVAINSDCGVNTRDPLMVSYTFVQNAGKTIQMTLEQTAGTPKSVKWEAGVVGNG